MTSIAAGGLAAGLALLALTVDETDEAFANVYSTAVSLQNALPHLSQRLLIGLAATGATVGALVITWAEYETFLFMLGSFFVPLFGVLLADWLLAGARYTRAEIFEAPSVPAAPDRRLAGRLLPLPVAASHRAERLDGPRREDRPGRHRRVAAGLRPLVRSRIALRAQVPALMLARVATVDGVFEVDLETEEVESGAGAVEPQHVETGLPRVVCAAAAGSTVAVVVESRPPMVVSHDAGQTWREAGRGLPPGFAVAVLDDDPDVIVLRRAQPALSLAGRRALLGAARRRAPGHRGDSPRSQLDRRRLSCLQRLAGDANRAGERAHLRLSIRVLDLPLCAGAPRGRRVPGRDDEARLCSCPLRNGRGQAALGENDLPAELSRAVLASTRSSEPPTSVAVPSRPAARSTALPPFGTASWSLGRSRTRPSRLSRPSRAGVARGLEPRSRSRRSSRGRRTCPLARACRSPGRARSRRSTDRPSAGTARGEAGPSCCPVHPYPTRPSSSAGARAACGRPSASTRTCRRPRRGTCSPRRAERRRRSCRRRASPRYPVM